MRGGSSFLTRHFWLVFGAIWLLVGLPFLGIGVTTFSQQIEFAKGAVIVDGTVLSKDIHHADRDSGTSTTYGITYRFQPTEGPPVQGSSSVDLDLWESLEERGPVAIEVIPGTGRSRVTGSGNGAVPWIFGIVGAVCSLAGGTIVGLDLRNRLLRRGLLRHGIPTLAEIVAVEPTNISVNRVTQWRFRYRYRDSVGQVHEGKSPLLSPSVAQELRAGDEGMIRYQPDAPGRSIWVGRDEAAS